MPLGGFRLNTIAANVGGGGISYYILEGSHNMSIHESLVDDSNNLYVSDFNDVVTKFNPDGSLAWQSQLNGIGAVLSNRYQQFIVKNGSDVRINVAYPQEATYGRYPYGWVNLSDATGAVSSYNSYRYTRSGTGFDESTDPRSIVSSQGDTYFFGRGTADGTSATILSKWSSSLTHQWTRFYVGEQPFDYLDNAYHVTTDSSNNIYLMGENEYLKLDNNGNFVRRGGYGSSQSVTRCFYDSVSDNIYFKDSFNIAMMNTNCSLQWSYEFLEPDTNNYVNQIACIDDNTGNLFLGAENGDNLYVMQIDSAGNFVNGIKIVGPQKFNNIQSIDHNAATNTLVITARRGEVFQNFPSILVLPSDLSTTGTYGSYTFSSFTPTRNNGSLSLSSSTSSNTSDTRSYNPSSISQSVSVTDPGNSYSITNL